MIFITTAETNQLGGELNGVGLTGLSGTGVLSDPRPAHHNSIWLCNAHKKTTAGVVCAT